MVLGFVIEGRKVGRWEVKRKKREFLEKKKRWMMKKREEF